jgi:hypothetical protein
MATDLLAGRRRTGFTSRRTISIVIRRDDLVTFVEVKTGAPVWLAARVGERAGGSCPR